MTEPTAPLAGGQRRWLAALDWWLDGGALGPVRRVAAAVVVAVGPWIVFVLSLAVISISSAPILGRAGLEDLRLTVTYAFCFAPMAAGPVGLAVAELARQFREDGVDLPLNDIFRLALVVAGGAATLLALVIGLALGMTSAGTVLTFGLLSGAAAMLWVCFAVLSALKAYRVLIAAFLGGIVLSVLGTAAAVRFVPSVQLLVWCFAAGLVFCVGQSLNHVRAISGGMPTAMRDGATLLFREIYRRRALAAGVTLALIGIWADKWAYWLGPGALRSAGGFLHFSRYDSVMFVAHLSMIPTFAGMLMLRERELSQAFRLVQRRLQERASNVAVRQAVDRLGRVAWTGGCQLVFVQATVAGMAVLAAPWIARSMAFDFQQFIVLRIALVAVLLFSVSYVSSIFLLLCGRTRHFLAVQVAFVVSNVVFSLVFINWQGFTAYPLFFSSLVAAALSCPAAIRSIQTYDFLYLLAENESLYETQD